MATQAPPEEQAKQWERRLMQGKCTIDDALSMCMALGVPVPPYVRESYERAWNTYRYEKKSDLAELLGVRITGRQQQVMETELLASHVRFLVDTFHGEGYPKTNPSNFDSTAFHKAAERVNKSPSYVFDLYHRKK